MCTLILSLSSLPSQDYHDEYAALGFEVTDVQTIGTEPTYPPIILTINQIIGIGVGGGLGLILILVLIITITW